MSDVHEHSENLCLLEEVVTSLLPLAEDAAAMQDALPRIGKMVWKLAKEARALEFRLARLEMEAEMRARSESPAQDPLEDRVAAELARPGTNVVPLPIERPIGGGSAA